ncbi:MAG: DUF4398 domain-containing protein [Myxococcota bacterium]
MRTNRETRSATAKHRSAATIFFTLGLLGLATSPGCATRGTPPGDSIGAAEYALRKAVEDGAGEFAPVDVRQAEDKLDRARAARAEGANQTAIRLANEVALEAQLAEAKAQNARVHRVRDEIDVSLDTLRTEIERGQR